jgi:outer membrane protein assembly factor BamB
MTQTILKNAWVISGLMLITTTLNAQVELAWKYKTEGRVYSTPLIDDGSVYFGSGDQNIYALNEANGELLWKFKTEGKVHSSPAVHGQTVLAGSQDGNLYCLDKLSGELKWKFESRGEKMYGLWDYYLSSPTVADGMVYWGSGDGSLYAINPVNGTKLWEFTTGDIVHATPVVDEESVYIGSFDGKLYKLNKYNGSLIWEFDTIGAYFFPKGEIQRGVTVHEGFVYFGSRDYNLYVLDKKTGKGAWNYRQPRGWIIATPTLYKDHVYFGSSDAHKFFCYSTKTADLVWEKELSMRVYGTALAHDDEVIFGTFDGKLISADYLTGKTNWVFQTDNSKRDHHTIFDDNGKFRSDFELYGEKWLESENRIHDLGAFLSSPVLASNQIFIGSSDGHLYCLTRSK